MVMENAFGRLKGDGTAKLITMVGASLADGLPAFEASLMDDRWLARHLQAATEVSSDVAIRQLLSGPSPITLSSHQKYRKGMEVAADLANLMSEVGTQFRVWLEILEEL